jgi:hypothetical protein
MHRPTTERTKIQTQKQRKKKKKETKHAQIHVTAQSSEPPLSIHVFKNYIV